MIRMGRPARPHGLLEGYGLTERGRMVVPRRPVSDSGNTAKPTAPPAPLMHVRGVGREQLGLAANSPWKAPANHDTQRGLAPLGGSPILLPQGFSRHLRTTLWPRSFASPMMDLSKPPERLPG